MPYANLNTHRIHYTDHAPSTPTNQTKSAPTLLLIHGLGSTQNFYQPIIPTLTHAGHRCIAFDNHLAGRSFNPETYAASPTASVRGIADDALALLKFLDVQGDVVIVGYSMGGMVPTTLASSAAEGEVKIKAIILLGPVHPTPQVADVFRARIPLVEEQGMEAMANSIPWKATGSKHTTDTQRAFIREMLLAQDVRGYVANCRAIEEATPPEYAGVKCPVLIVAGGEDASAPVKGCEFILEGAGGRSEGGAAQEGEVVRRLVVLEGIGHWHCVEAPEKVSREVLGFLGEVS
jgi:pimeloyl-ACP methyl ester carboxylesterase